MDLRSIFDDGKAMLLREAQQWIHIHGVAIDVNRHDGARARRDPVLDLLDVDAPRLGIAVDQDWNAIAVGDGQGAGDDGEGGKDDFRSRFQVETVDGHLQRRCAVADRDSVAPAAVSCPLLFEFIDEPARGRDPAGPYTFEQVFRFARTKQRFVDRYDCQNRSLS